jgi:DNA-directed RNA polymerase subunit RPC12/RpoP
VNAIEQPISRSLYAESWLIVWSSCWLAVLFLGVIAVFAFGWPWVVAVALPVFVLSQAVAIAFAFRFRCPACHHRLLVQGFRTLHTARKILFLGIASWIAVAFDIARHREFTCMHCGERCIVKV